MILKIFLPQKTVQRYNKKMIYANFFIYAVLVASQKFFEWMISS